MWIPMDYFKQKRRILFLVPPRKDAATPDVATPQERFQPRLTQALAVGENIVLRVAQALTVCAMSPMMRMAGLAAMQVLTCGVALFFETERIVVEKLLRSCLRRDVGAREEIAGQPHALDMVNVTTQPLT